MGVLGSGKGGGGGGGTTYSATPSPYEASMANIANQLYTESTPLRTENWRQMVDFMYGGGIPEALNPVMEAGKSTIEGQYGNAKENIIAQTPNGGGLTSALTGLESDRANSLGSLQSNIAQDLYNKAYGAAMGTPQTSLSGLGTAAGTFSNRSSQAMAANAQSDAAANQSMGSLGMGLGKLGATLIPKL